MGDVASKAVLSDFSRDVDRAEQLLNLIHVFRDFAAKESEPSGYAHDLWTTAQAIRTDLPILSGSILLYLCGRFDYFVKQLVGTIVDDLVDKSATYDELPSALRREYLIGTLSINQKPNKFGFTAATAAALAAELANNLAGSTVASSGLRLDAATVTITESNMNPDTLVGLFRRVGITNLWDTLSQQLPLKTHLGESTNADCKAAAIARLEDIMDERNRIAHPTATTSFPDAKAVQDIAQYLRVIAHELVNLALAPR
jgi:hypothetical protein